VSSEPVQTAGPDVEPPQDVRSGRPYLLSPSPLKTFVRRVSSVATLVALDVAGLILGLYAALALRELVYADSDILWGLLWKAEANWLPFLTLITVLVFWQAGLYASRERRAGLGKIVSSLVLVALVAFAFGIGTGFDFTRYGLIPAATVLTALAIGLFRSAYERITLDLMRIAGMRRRALIAGDDASVAKLRGVLMGRRGVDYEFVGSVPPSLEGLTDALTRLRPDELILDETDFDEPTLLELVEAAHRCGVKVRVAPNTTELLIQRGEYVPGEGAPLFELRPPVFAGTDWAVKRAFDVVVSVAVFVVGLPLWLAIAAAIKLTSPGPVFYLDRRIGVGEREFPMFKFRTMVAGAAERQAELESRNEADGALFKIRDDPRVTRVGALLRRLSLDEAPQVLNVLRGEMSLVGPRPLPLRDYRKLDDWHRKRYLVLPGITGLWQISGRSNLTFDDLVRLDFYYLENWSIWLDISIIVKTPTAVLARRGAY
jgi:exopolysaccharide biosynthesis polyprenyl glycosylphosphotransferase